MSGLGLHFLPLFLPQLLPIQPWCRKTGGYWWAKCSIQLCSDSSFASTYGWPQPAGRRGPHCSRIIGPDDHFIHAQLTALWQSPIYFLVAGTQKPPSGCHRRICTVGGKVVYSSLKRVGSFHASISGIAYGDLCLQALLTAAKGIRRQLFLRGSYLVTEIRKSPSSLGKSDTENSWAKPAGKRTKYKAMQCDRNGRIGTLGSLLTNILLSSLRPQSSCLMNGRAGQCDPQGTSLEHKWQTTI